MEPPFIELLLSLRSTQATMTIYMYVRQYQTVCRLNWKNGEFGQGDSMIISAGVQYKIS